MVTDSPETVVRKYYEYADAEQYDDLLACVAEEIRYERPGQQAIEGRESLRSFFVEERSIEDGSHKIEDIVVEDDTIAVRGSFSGVLGDQEVTIGFAAFHELDDGEIARQYAFTDRDEV
jgi:ketosteroid isomerase-like protein